MKSGYPQRRSPRYRLLPWSHRFETMRLNYNKQDPLFATRAIV